jgi:hypothetical protein
MHPRWHRRHHRIGPTESKICTPSHFLLTSDPIGSFDRKTFLLNSLISNFIILNKNCRPKRSNVAPWWVQRKALSFSPTRSGMPRNYFASTVSKARPYAFSGRNSTGSTHPIILLVGEPPSTGGVSATRRFGFVAPFMYTPQPGTTLLHILR